MAAVTSYAVEQRQGIYYLDATTVTMEGRDASSNSTFGVVAISADTFTWVVYDQTGAQVANGTGAAHATEIVVVSGGSFVGGGAIYPGWFLFVPTTSDNGQCSGAFCISPTTSTASKLYVPSSTESNKSLAAWYCMAQDRELYGFTAGNQSAIVSQFATDPYYTMTQDSARPHLKWVSSALQPNAANTTVASGSNGVNINTLTGGAGQVLDVASSSGSGQFTACVVEGTGGAFLAYMVLFGTSSTGVLSEPATQSIAGGFFATSGVLATGNGVYGYANPVGSEWGGNLTGAMVTAGYTGAFYEGPFNEPESGGWAQPETAWHWTAMAQSVIAADATANPIGYCSAGIYNTSTIANMATFLGDIPASTIAAFSNHMENSHQNVSSLTVRNQYEGGIKAQFATSGYTNLDMWYTETGIDGQGTDAVCQPRREARQRVMLELSRETYGWAKEKSYHYAYYQGVAGGSSPMAWSAYTGSYNSYAALTAGALAVHVMSEALYGTSCTPTAHPTVTPFGPTDEDDNAMFYYQQYTTSHGGNADYDRVIIKTNGVESGTLTFNATSAPAGTYAPDGSSAAWDGFGKPRAVTSLGGGLYSVPFDDMPTYLFFAPGITFTPVDTDQKAITFMASATNICTLGGVTIINAGDTSAVGALNSGVFNANNSGITGVPTPYSDSTTAPQTLTVSNFGTKTIGGYLITTVGEPWQTNGCGIVAVTVKIGGVTVDTYTCASAVGVEARAPYNDNSFEFANYTTWWTGATTLVRSITPTSGTTIEFIITPSYGGMPDSTTNALGLNAPQTLQLAQLMVFEGTVEPGTFPSAALALTGV